MSGKLVAALLEGGLQLGVHLLEARANAWLWDVCDNVGTFPQRPCQAREECGAIDVQHDVLFGGVNDTGIKWRR